MLLEEAVTLTKRLIYSEAKHKDYPQTVALAETYKIFITGKGIEKKLIQFVQREEIELFAQRVRLTKSITPAIASTIRQPFNKVTRNDRVRKTLKLQNESRKQIVDKMIASFYGAPQKQNRGLEYWMKTRFTELQFTDPNSWVVMEWETPQDRAQVVNVRPFEVSAAMAVNFLVTNDVVKWLLVKQDISYVNGERESEEQELPIQTGCRYTLYDENVTIVFEQINPDYYQFQNGEIKVEIKSQWYVLRAYTPNVGYVPAFRIGYKRDEETDGRTFVNPWHDGLCYFEKSLKTVSELDLTMTLHAFPQKLQYVQKCSGVPATTDRPAKTCNNGYQQGTTNICGSCKGVGYKLHTSAQDAILVPMPTGDPRNEDIIDLTKLVHYVSPPIETIKFQNEYVQQLKREVQESVFNSQIFNRKNGGGVTQSATATETDFNMQAVYDTLEPFTEKYSEVWKDAVTTFAVIAGEPLDKVDVSHDFPADYKLKTDDVLLTERKTATESGAPAFLVETIDDDLAAIIYAGDDLGRLKYQVKRRYAPFSGKNEDEVALLLASEFVLEESKILYSNFELIFRELEQEDPAFWIETNLATQKEAVDKKVAEWKVRLEAQKPEPILPAFSGGVVNPDTDEESDDNPAQ